MKEKMMETNWMEIEYLKYAEWNANNVIRLPQIILGEYKRLFELLQNKNVFGLFLQIKDTYEIFVKIPALIAATIEIKNGVSEKNGNWLFKFFEKDLALGDWVTICYTYTNIVSNEYLKRVLEKTKKLIDSSDIVKWRNDWVGHGALAQEKNEEFVDSLKEKIDFIFQFVKECVIDLEKMNLILDKDEWKFVNGTESISLHPWIITKNNRTYLFDSYRSNKEKFVYLDYENGGKNECCIDELKRLVESLCMQNTVRKFCNKFDDDLILTSEDMVIKELKKTQRYIRPEYLCQQIIEFTNLPKGIMLLQMGEGFGKTSLATALDNNGLNRIKITDCMARAYYINDTYASNVDYFISNMYDLFRIDRDGKVLYRGNLPLLSRDDMNSSTKLCELLSFYREKGKDSKLLFILDGIDEIVTDGDFSISNFIPEESEIPDGVYILCTCRNDWELGCAPEVYRKIHQLNFTKKINYNVQSEEYLNILNKYIKREIPTTTQDDRQALMKLAKFKFDEVDKICKRVGEKGSCNVNELDMVQWDIKYLERMFGEKFFNQIILFLSNMYIINEPLTVNELSVLSYGRNVVFQDLYLLWYMQDLIRSDRNSQGNKISIKNATIAEYFFRTYSDNVIEVAETIRNKFIEDKLTFDRSSIIIAKKMNNIMLYKRAELLKSDIDIITEKIISIGQNLDVTKINNIIDAIGVYDSTLYMIKIDGLEGSNIITLEIMAKQAELYEIYGLLNLSKSKYDECISFIEQLKCVNIQDFINIKIKYSILLDKMGIVNETLNVLNEILDKISDGKVSQENKMLLYANRGHILQKIGRIQDALTDLNIAINILESAEELQANAYQASICYLNRSTLVYSIENDVIKAIDDVRKAIDITEGNTVTAIKINRARALLNYVFIIHKENIKDNITPMVDEAISILETISLSEELFEIDVLANAYCNKGLLLEKEGKIEPALDEYKKAVILLENYYIQGRCYCILELYKAYHLLIEKGQPYEDKIYNMLVNDIDLSRFEYVTWALSAWLDLFERDYKKQVLLKMCEKWIDKFCFYKQKFISEDIKAIIAMVICCEEEYMQKGLRKEAVELLKKACEVKSLNGEIDEVYAFLIKQTGLCYVKENDLVNGNLYYEKSIQVYISIMKTCRLEDMNELVMLCANKGLVNLAQKDFQGAYDSFYLGLDISKKELEKGNEIDKEVMSLIIKNISMLINHRDEANIIVY
jgi:tetratricopeptide (TPR) repeat protein